MSSKIHGFAQPVHPHCRRGKKQTRGFRVDQKQIYGRAGKDGPGPDNAGLHLTRERLLRETRDQGGRPSKVVTRRVRRRAERVLAKMFTGMTREAKQRLRDRFWPAAVAEAEKQLLKEKNAAPAPPKPEKGNPLLAAFFANAE